MYYAEIKNFPCIKFIMILNNIMLLRYNDLKMNLKNLYYYSSEKR